MISLKEQNFYDVLEIDFDASAFDVNHAYKELCQLYNHDALASYSLFSREERDEILTILEEAHSTLIDDKKRSRYNQSLRENGLLGEEMGSKEGRRRISDISFSPFTSNKSLTMRNELSAMVSSNPEIQEILRHDALYGRDLKRVRDKLGVSLEDIADITKVRIHFLRAIEEDDIERIPSLIFLKSFLRTYIQSIGLDADTITNRYLSTVKH